MVFFLPWNWWTRPALPRAQRPQVPPLLKDSLLGTFKNLSFTKRATADGNCPSLCDASPEIRVCKERTVCEHYSCWQLDSLTCLYLYTLLAPCFLHLPRPPEPSYTELSALPFTCSYCVGGLGHLRGMLRVLPLFCCGEQCHHEQSWILCHTRVGLFAG